MTKKSKNKNDDKVFKWETDPFFMVVPHLSLPKIHFVFRRLSPASWEEIEVKIKNNKIYPDQKLTASETEWIKKNLI